MTTSHNRAVALLVTAFVVGVLVGGVALTMAFRAGKADFVFRGGRGMAWGGADWTKKLDLAGSTRDTVLAIRRRGEHALDSIVRSKIGPQMDSLWESVRTEIESRRGQTRSEIRALLSPTQQQRYDSMTKAADENRRRMRAQGGRGGPGGPAGSAGRGGSPRGSR